MYKEVNHNRPTANQRTFAYLCAFAKTTNAWVNIGVT